MESQCLVGTELCVAKQKILEIACSTKGMNVYNIIELYTLKNG